MIFWREIFVVILEKPSLQTQPAFLATLNGENYIFKLQNLANIKSTFKLVKKKTIKIRNYRLRKVLYFQLLKDRQNIKQKNLNNEIKLKSSFNEVPVNSYISSFCALFLTWIIHLLSFLTCDRAFDCQFSTEYIFIFKV